LLFERNRATDYEDTVKIPTVDNNLIQNSPAVKNVYGPKKAIVKKDVKSKVVAKKWL